MLRGSFAAYSWQTDRQSAVVARWSACVVQGRDGPACPANFMIRRLRDHIKPHIRRARQKVAKTWVGKNILVPTRHAFKTLGFLIIFLFLAVGAGVWAFLLQGVAFPAAGSSGQPISATVYVEKLPAEVALQSTFTPSKATDNFSLKVKVTGPTKEPDPWLLIVQCAAPKSAKTVQLYSEGPAGTQPVGTAQIKSGASKRHMDFAFTCSTGLTQQGQDAATVVNERDLNLSLPVLEQNPLVQSGLPDAPLYAEKARGKYTAVVEVQALSGSPCPAPASSRSSASPPVSSSGPPAGTSSPSPAATSPTSATATATTSPSFPAAASPSAAASSSPSPSATTSVTSSPTAVACYSPIPPGTTSMKYSFPAPATGTTVATSETLSNVALSDDRIDAIYPQGQLAPNAVTWQGSVNLSPSLIATNLESAARQNKDAFWAGLLYGVAAALAIPYLVDFYKEWERARKGGGEEKAAEGSR